MDTPGHIRAIELSKAIEIDTAKGKIIHTLFVCSKKKTTFFFLFLIETKQISEQAHKRKIHPITVLKNCMPAPSSLSICIYFSNIPEHILCHHIIWLHLFIYQWNNYKHQQISTVEGLDHDCWRSRDWTGDHDHSLDQLCLLLF